MRRPAGLLLAAGGLLGLLLAGCGAPASPVSGHSAAAVLASANSKALGTSYQAEVSFQLHVDLSKITGLSASDSQELPLIQDELNAAQFTAVVDEQSPTVAEVSFRVTPFMSRDWYLIEDAGKAYFSEDGKTWYAGSSSSSTTSPGFGSLRKEVQSWGQDLRNAAQVKNLGQTKVDGQAVEEIETLIPASAVHQLYAQVLSQLATQLSSTNSQVATALPALEQLIQFGPSRGTSYVSTSTGKLVEDTGSTSLTLELSQLAVLDPGAAGLPGGTVPIGFSFSADFSDYGQDFGIKAPSQVSSGTPPLPDGLSGALSQA